MDTVYLKNAIRRMDDRQKETNMLLRRMVAEMQRLRVRLDPEFIGASKADGDDVRYEDVVAAIRDAARLRPDLELIVDLTGHEGTSRSISDVDGGSITRYELPDEAWLIVKQNMAGDVIGMTYEDRQGVQTMAVLDGNLLYKATVAEDRAR